MWSKIYIVGAHDKIRLANLAKYIRLTVLQKGLAFTEHQVEANRFEQI